MTIDEAMAGMTVSQVMRLRCAINLHKLATDLVAISEWKVGENDNDRRLEQLCTAGAVAECYVANMRHLNDLLRCKFDRYKVSDEETVAAWREQYEWIVRNGLLPAITRDNGVRREPLPFDAIHSVAMEAHDKIIKFRKEIEK